MIWSAGMAILLPAVEAISLLATRAQWRATTPAAQQKPVSHLSCVCEGEPFMSSGQQSIGMPMATSICMLAWVSPDEIAELAAEAPSGSIASETETASIRMVRTNRMPLLSILWLQ